MTSVRHSVECRRLAVEASQLKAQIMQISNNTEAYRAVYQRTARRDTVKRVLVKGSDWL